MMKYKNFQYQCNLTTHDILHAADRTIIKDRAAQKMQIRLIDPARNSIANLFEF